MKSQIVWKILNKWQFGDVWSVVTAFKSKIDKDRVVLVFVKCVIPNRLDN